MGTRKTTHETFQYKDLTIHVARKNMKRVYMRLHYGSEDVFISCPHEYPQESILSFIDSKESWIHKHFHRFEERAHYEHWDLEEEHPTIFIFGEQKDIVIVRSPKRKKILVSLVGTELTILCGSHQTTDELTQAVCNFLEDYLLQKIEEIRDPIERRVNQWPLILDIEHHKGRWGICYMKEYRISLSRDLVHFPVRCLEVIYTHELCHFYSRPHGKRFYMLLHCYAPDWKEAVAILNGHEGDLDNF